MIGLCRTRNFYLSWKTLLLSFLIGFLTVDASAFVGTRMRRSVAPPDLEMLTTWDTRNLSTGSSADNEISLPIQAPGTYDFVVEWGDGTSTHITNATLAGKLHTYATPGIYNIRMYGRFNRFIFGGTGDRLKILDVSKWSDNEWLDFSQIFSGCANVQITAVKPPNLKKVTSLSNAFKSATAFNSDISNWDVQNVTNMFSAFEGATSFNQPLNSWNTGKVTLMTTMFSGASSFNQPLNSWDTKNVTGMSSMFRDATSFNQDLDGWNTSKVTTIASMFNGASSFNGAVGTWDTQKVTSMASLFSGATVFNKPISAWNISLVNSLPSLFLNARAFNQPLNWNTGHMTSMLSTFQGAISFNQDLSGWNVCNVIGTTNFSSTTPAWVLPKPNFGMACPP